MFSLKYAANPFPVKATRTVNPNKKSTRVILMVDITPEVNKDIVLGCRLSDICTETINGH
ncbi:hypothetical protein JCM30204_14320 [Dysgonomonas termitidis]